MDKPVLVMIHGLVGSLSYFDPSSRIGKAAVETWDLLGCGELSDAPSDMLTLSAQVEHVAERIRTVARGGVWLLGHSMGGAIAMLLADQYSGLVSGLIDVEGNFTKKDAFWSGAIVGKSPREWSREYHNMQGDIEGWLERCDITPSSQRIEWAEHLLDHQPASAVYAMSEALVTETSHPSYLEAVHRVVERGLPIHLIAGERSADAWDVPEFVRAAAKSYTVIPKAGHVMMLEQPDKFCKTVNRILG